MARRAKRKASPVEAGPPKPAPAPEQWPSRRVERWPIERPKDHPRNVRVHPEEQLAQIEALFREYGQTRPILVNEADETIAAGHGTRAAMRRAGAEVIDVCLAPNWTPEMIREYMLADNQSALNAEWNVEALGIELADLKSIPTVDISRIGFSDRALRKLTAKEGNKTRPGKSNPDALPDVTAAPIAEPGDVWQLGAHRLVCGDCSDRAVRAKALHGLGAPVLFLSDPPYEYASLEGGGPLADRPYHAKIGQAGIDSFAPTSLVPLLAKTSAIFTSKALLADYLDLARDLSLPWDVCVFHRASAIPYHSSHLMTDLDYVVIIGHQAPQPGLEHRDYSKCFSLPSWDRPVPWAKPVELLARFIRLFSAPGDVVIDGYVGSGSTIIAAEQTGRACVAMEIAPAFVDMAIERWQTFSGRNAVLTGENRDFAAVSGERREARRAQAAA